jgi:hypothetical protein
VLGVDAPAEAVRIAERHGAEASGGFEAIRKTPYATEQI